MNVHFAQVMGIAQAVQAIVIAIRRQAIMNRHPHKVGQDAEVLHGDQAAPFMMPISDHRVACRWIAAEISAFSIHPRMAAC